MKNKINIVEANDSWMYLVKNKALGYELAENWMFFWTFFMPIALVLSMFSNGNALIYKGLLYIILIFAMTIIRRNIISSFIYLSVNIFIIFLVFIISFSLIEKLTFGGASIICFIVSIKKRSKEVIKFYNISMLLWMEVIMIICYFFACNFNLTFMMNLINFASINIAITCILYIFISRILGLKEWESEFIKEYSKRIRRIKLTCTTLISGIIIFFLLLAWKVGLYELLDMITNKILTFLNTTHPYISKTIKTKPVAKNTAPNLDAGFKNIKFNGRSNNLAAKIIGIVKFILLIVVVIVAVYLLILIFNKAKDFYRSLRLKKVCKKEESEFVFSLEDVKKEIKEKVDKIRAPLILSFNMSNRKKIRKLYYKLIKSYRTKGFSAYNFDTPNEIEDRIKEVLNKNIDTATQIYEKARYSEGECSKEDVDKMKLFFSNLK